MSNTNTNPSEAEQDNPRPYLIGYALLSKKEQSFLQPSLLKHASQHGIVFTQIDPHKPLIEQGPFHCILHKLYDPEWTLQLRRFADQNPLVPIIDSPDRINLLRNRVYMLEVVAQAEIPKNVGGPAQWVVSEDRGLVEQEVSYKFPAIAKPSEADGTEGSHQLYMVFDREGLIGLPTPIVVQEFVNHGGVVFKVYVMGEQVKCMKRRSLPDLSEDKLRVSKGSLPFSQISNTAKEETCDFAAAEMPPEWLLAELASGLREKLGLNLFNIDLIRAAKETDRYLVIDINYFPGYAKLPGYEHLLTQFFLDVVRKLNVAGK